MTNKIVYRLQLSCMKCQTKALQVAAAAQGVNFVGFEGDSKENLVVVGDDVDPVKLAIKLRKKVKVAEILSVTAVDSN
ncbi:Disease resistance protein RGA5 [Linum grandiflorum]